MTMGCNNKRCWAKLKCMRFQKRHELLSTMYAPDGVLCVKFLSERKYNETIEFYAITSDD